MIELLVVIAIYRHSGGLVSDNCVSRQFAGRCQKIITVFRDANETDGNVNQVIDLYIEAGFDCLQPLEVKAQMDLRTLAPLYGQRLAFFGNVDIMVLATNEPARIEEEVHAKLMAGKACRGYIFHSDHSVPPSVSWPNFQFVMELVKQYGSYC